MKLYYPPRTDNPNLNVWLAHLANELSDPANLFAGLGKMTGATFDWNARQLTNVGGISIGSPALPGKGNLLIGDGGHINIEGGGNINLDAGGDIILAPSDSSPALIKWSTIFNLGAAVTAERGLAIWPTNTGTGKFKLGYDPVNNVNKPFSVVEINTKNNIYIDSVFDADFAAGVDITTTAAYAGVSLRVEEAGSIRRAILRATEFAPEVTNVLDIGTTARRWKDGWFAGNLVVDGTVQIGPTAPAGKVHIDQSVSNAVIPVLVLDQADISEGFINFIGSNRGSIAGTTNSTTSARIELNGTVYRVALYVDA